MPWEYQQAAFPNALGTLTAPLTGLSKLLSMQDVEDHKPRLSKISWLPDICRIQGSIIGTVAFPVLTVTLFAAAVALANELIDRNLQLTNSVVPLLSVVVGLLLVFRNSSAYERYSEGRKDFTALISNARNLSRLIWIHVVLPPATSAKSKESAMTKARLTEEKKKLVKLLAAFAIATKHHLRAEAGIMHADLEGLLPPRLMHYDLPGFRDAPPPTPAIGTQDVFCASPSPLSPLASSYTDLESQPSVQGQGSRHRQSRLLPGHAARRFLHLGRPTSTLKRRPTAVRVVSSNEQPQERHKGRATERTPLIKSGVVPDVRDRDESQAPLGKMVELGLPLIIAHEISRSIFRFRRLGCLEAVGPAGVNSMQSLVQSMTDQLGSMERVMHLQVTRVQTPLPYVFCVHLKQCVSAYLFALPFTLVDIMGWRMVPVVTVVAFTLMGVEGIAAEIEQPFGTDPNDLNLDLYCAELRCEIEYLLERLPEGDEDEDDDEILSRLPFAKPPADDGAAGDDAGGDDEDGH